MSLSGYFNTFYTRRLTGERDYPALQGVAEADVCVVGGGLAGLNTALGLVQRGKSVVLVEAKRIAGGASGRNGGFVDKGYAAGEEELAGKLGVARARELVDLTKAARLLIRQRIKDFSIDCGPVIDGVLNVSVRDRADSVRRYVSGANAHFDLGYEFWPREKVRELARSELYFDGFFAPNDFQFDPLRYSHGIARAAIALGARIFENSPARKIERCGADWRVTTDEGSVRAKDIVLCCATEAASLDKRLGHAVFPVETYILATDPIDPALLAETVNTRCAIYELKFACNYYRRTDDNRLLWGGRVALGAQADSIAPMMLEDMFKVYPKLKGNVRADVAWSGLLAYAPHKMPQIGKLEDGYWHNTAFGGHGLCATTAGGEAIAAAIAGDEHAVHLFDPFRPSFAGGAMGRYAASGVYYWWRARDWLGV
jgi:gamma-glutamylputrescine oxidase